MTLPPCLQAITGDWGVQEYERMEQQFFALKETVFDRFKPKTSLDIGSNLAVFDVVMVRLGGIRQVHLLDGDKGKRIPRVKFAEGADPWGNVQCGRDLVRLNVPQDVDVYAHAVSTAADVQRFNAAFYHPLDLIVSTKAWGHHFPIDTYMAMTLRCLKIGGVIIVDLRERHAEAQHWQLRTVGFRQLLALEVSDRGKCMRYAFQRER